MIEGQLLDTTEAATTIGLASCQIETVPASEIQFVVAESQAQTPIRSVYGLLFGGPSTKIRRHPGSCGWVEKP